MSLFEHVDYPHTPGTLCDCMACEYGECVCDATGNGYCVSEYCQSNWAFIDPDESELLKEEC